MDYEKFYNEGLKQTKEGDYSNAVKTFTIALSLRKESVSALFQRAFCYQQLGKFRHAIRDLNQLLSIDPNDNRAYFERGLNYCNLGSYSRAVTSINHAVRRQPDLLSAYFYRNDYNQQNNKQFLFKDQQLLPKLNQSIKKDLFNVSSRLIRGIYYYVNNQLLISENDFKTVLRLDSSQPIANKMIELINLNKNKNNNKTFNKINTTIIDSFHDKAKYPLKLSSINDLVGLTDVKKQLNNYLAVWKMNLELRKRGLPENNAPLNLIFVGDHGTGKTTVAKVLSHQLHQMKILEDDHFIMVTPNNLVSLYPGQSYEKTKYVLDKARNGVILINDIDRLGDYDNNNVGYEVLEQLVDYSSNPDNQILIILSGDEDEITTFMNQADFDFKNQFDNNWIHFTTYSGKNLVELLILIIKKQKKDFDSKATSNYLKDNVDRYLSTHESSDTSNSQFIRKIVDKLNDAQSLRLSQQNLSNLSSETLQTLTNTDVKRALTELNILENNELNNNQETANEKLNSMIGLTSVKSQIKKYVANAMVDKRLGQKHFDFTGMNMVFAGSAGTGKTTVARLFSEIMYEYGILKTNHCNEVSARDLVASYVGQTAPKTHQQVMNSLGGVLFIDEAYALQPNAGGDFNREAVDQLVKDMEDYKEDLIVILAGYTSPMEQFLSAANPGLRSRFSHWIEFPDYTNEEMIKILDYQLKQKHLYFENNSTRQLLNQSLINILSNSNLETLGNARFIRKVVSDLIESKNFRLVSQMDQPGFDNDQLRVINGSDVLKTFNNMRKEYLGKPKE